LFSFKRSYKRSKAGGCVPERHLLDSLRQPFFEVILPDSRDAPMPHAMRHCLALIAYGVVSALLTDGDERR
jgi:hypothetical protein